MTSHVSQKACWFRFRRHLRGVALLLASFVLMGISACPHRADAQQAIEPANTNAPILRVETGAHTSDVLSISVNADQRYLVSGSQDKTVRVWDASNGELLSTLRPPIPAICQGDYSIGAGFRGQVFAVAISPDGRLIACGGFFGGTPEGGYCLYIFDRVSGQIVERLGGFAQIATSLAYSSDGRYLAVGTNADCGLSLYETSNYKLVGSGTGYTDAITGLEFCTLKGDKTGLRLASASGDGAVRLYSVNGNAANALQLLRKYTLPSGIKPSTVTFSPDRKRVAVSVANGIRPFILTCNSGMTDFTNSEQTLDAQDDKPDPSDNLCCIAWSADGQTLYASGTYLKYYSPHWKIILRTWGDSGRASPIDVPIADNSIFQVLPRRGGGIYWASADSSLGALDARNTIVFHTNRTVAEFNLTGASLGVSSDGTKVRFQYSPEDLSGAGTEFTLDEHGGSLGTGSLIDAPGSRTTSNTLKIVWTTAIALSINGVPVKLDTGDIPYDSAVAPDNTFLIGSSWYVSCLDSHANLRWRETAPSYARMVNASGDGRLAVAAFSDGTIKWYRMTDGKELLTLFPDADKTRWVAWTPSGYYDCSPGGEDLIGWHINRGEAVASDFYPASRFSDTFYRPDVVGRVLTTLDEATALSQANTAAGSRSGDVQQAKDALLRNQPPVISILSPQSGDPLSGDHVTVRYTLRTPAGTPATVLRVLVDGRPAMDPVPLNLAVSATSTSTGLQQEISVPVPSHDCTISLIAQSADAVSVASSVSLHASAARQAQPVNGPGTPEFVIQPKLYMLAVGISAYQDNALRLTYPDKDAADFVQAFQKQTKLYREVDVYQGRALTDSAATKDAIEDGLDWLQRQTTSNDVAIIYLSGHGDNDAAGNYYFLPANFDPDRIKSTGLPWTDIYQTTKAIAGKVLLFDDSCHSGNILGGATKGGGPDITRIVNELISTENGTAVFAASTGDESALENPAWGNGAFTKAVVEGLNGAADYDHSGVITFNMLALYVPDRVKFLTNGAQHPTANKPPTIRDFPIALKP